MSPNDVIRTEREKKGWSQKDLADRVGISQVAIMKIEQGTTKKSKHIPLIAQLLDIPLSRLDPSLSHTHDAPLSRNLLPRAERTISPHDRRTDSPPPGQLLGSFDLPVFSAAPGGARGLILSAVPYRSVARPHVLLGLKEAFAILIVGNTMALEYREGDVAYVDPNLLPRVGDACLFQSTVDGNTEISIKYLDKPAEHSEVHWHVSQTNPEKKFTMKKADWPTCYVLVGKQSGR
jgi:transcriptional regulator with XRE-family HTH domain